MCTAVDGGSIHRKARSTRAASDQTSTTPITNCRTKDRRKPLRSGVLVVVSGFSVTFQNTSPRRGSKKSSLVDRERNMGGIEHPLGLSCKDLRDPMPGGRMNPMLRTPPRHDVGSERQPVLAPVFKCDAGHRPRWPGRS